MTVVIDYGAGNVGSVLNALEELGEEAEVITEADALEEAARIILPGVGAMAPAMAKLRAASLDVALDKAVRERAVPFLGICLGMQIMCKRGHEGRRATDGLGWVDGEVVELEAAPPERLVPHMGWAEVAWQDDEPLFEGLRDRSSFYFCHSFHARLADDAPRSAVVELGGAVTAALRCGSAVGVQFHPERSSNAGLRLIENFLDWDGSGSA